MFSAAANIFLHNKTPLIHAQDMPLTKANLKWTFHGSHLDHFIVCYPLLAFSLCHIKSKLLIFTVEAFHKGGLHGSLSSSISTAMDKDFYPDHQFGWKF